MQVTQKRFEDQGERDADGYFGGFFPWVIYRFAFPTRVLVVRCFEHMSDEATFLSSESLPGGTSTTFTEIPYGDPEFREAVGFLRTSERMRVVDVFIAEKYVRVDFAQLAD